MVKREGKILAAEGTKARIILDCVKAEYPAGKQIDVTALARKLGLKRGTVSGILSKYRSLLTLIQDKPATDEQVQAVKPIETVDPGKVADALLSRVVEAIQRHDKLTTELQQSHVTNDKLQTELRTTKKEYDTVLKLHNEQARTRTMVDGAELVRTARIMAGSTDVRDANGNRPPK